MIAYFANSVNGFSMTCLLKSFVQESKECNQSNTMSVVFYIVGERLNFANTK